MRFTRIRDLVFTGLGTAVLVHLFLVLDYAALPPLPTAAGVTLFVLAGLEFGLATSLRARLHGGKPTQPLVFARSVALAKASSLLGAIMAGAWLAVLVYAVPRQGRLVAAAHDTISGAVGLGCAVALIGAALWLEHSCRAPHDPNRHQDDT